MFHRKLGHTGLDVSVIAFGTWQLGGKRWQGLSDEESLALLRGARALGINLFDVSAAYGQYQDERRYLQSRAQELVGQAFEGRRREVIYNLKIGHLDEYTHRVDFSPARLVDFFQQSLRRLRTDHADICLLHAPSLAQIKDGRALSVLQTFRAQGLVGAIGYSLEDEPEHVLAALEQDIDVIELQYNLLSPDCAAAILKAREHGIGILASGPFKRGFLSGRFRTPEELPLADDYWKYNLDQCRAKVEQYLGRVRGLLDAHGSPQALRKEALRFVLQSPGVSAAVVGHRSLDEVKENVTLLRELCA